MAVLSRPLSYLYVMAPRTACTAVGDVLCKQVEGWWFPEKDLHDADGDIVVQRKHCRTRQLVHYGLLDAGELDDLFVFTGVRNTFDSLVSLWVKKTTSYQPLLDDPDSFVNRVPGFADDMRWMLDHSFSEWIEREYGHIDDDQPHHLYAGYIDDADVIMRFENLQAHFEAALAEVGITDPPEIPLLNPTEEREDDYRTYYTDHARKTVERVFAADLERFNYTF